MSTLEIVSGCTLEHIDQMAETMREVEKTDFKRVYPSVWEGLIDCCLQSDFDLRTVVADDKTMAIFGLVRRGNVGVPWMAVSDGAVSYAKSGIELARRVIDSWLVELHGLTNLVPADDQPAIDLLEVLGFQIGPESDGYRTFWRGQKEGAACVSPLR